MMSPYTSESRLLGLFELDENGKVLFASLEAASGQTNGGDQVEGADFFSDVARFANSIELQTRFEAFIRLERQAQSFDFTCHYQNGPDDVRVIMARLNRDGMPPSYLMHVRPADALAQNMSA